MSLKEFDYRDPEEIIRAVTARYALTDGDVFLVAVREPSDAQEIVHMKRYARRRWARLDDHELAMFLSNEARRMPIPERGRDAPQYSIMTVVARLGYAVIGPHEIAWVRGWLYSNHLMDAYSGSVMVITEHGWHDWTTGWGDSTPRLAAAANA